MDLTEKSMQRMAELHQKKDIEKLGYMRLGLACTECKKMQGFIYILPYDFGMTIGWKFICKECQNAS